MHLLRRQLRRQNSKKKQQNGTCLTHLLMRLFSLNPSMSASQGMDMPADMPAPPEEEAPPILAAIAMLAINSNSCRADQRACADEDADENRVGCSDSLEQRLRQQPCLAVTACERLSDEREKGLPGYSTMPLLLHCCTAAAAAAAAALPVLHECQGPAQAFACCSACDEGRGERESVTLDACL